jgi:hypothetical protein
MNAKYLLLVALVLLASFGIALFANSQSSSSSDYKKRVESFFSKVKVGEYQGAIDYIYSGNPWLSTKADEIQKIKSQFIGLPNLVGPYLGHELLSEESLAGRLVHIDYLVAFERQPIRFAFEYYKAKDDWMIYSFSYADDLDDWIKEKAKLDFIYKTPPKD